MIQYSSILSWLIAIPLVGAVLLLFIPSAKTRILRNTALTITLFTFILTCVAARLFDWTAVGEYGANLQLMQKHLCLARIGFYYSVGVDGISLPLLLLTTGIALLACLASLTVDKHIKAYFVLFLLLLAATIGTFVALDMLLFFGFFQLAVVPLFLLIGLWGGPRKEAAALKMILFALAGGICMMIAVAGLHFYALAPNPAASFDLILLANNPSLTELFKSGAGAAFAPVAFWLLFVGFAVRLPLFPLHTWISDALAEAPTPIATLMVAATFNTAAYGLLRVSYAILPQQAIGNWWMVSVLAVVSMVYSAFCALGQKDVKRQMAYASMTHMGFILLGIALLTPAGLNGALFHMLGQGVVGAMMFTIAGVIADRAHHRDLDRLGGLAVQMPNFMGLALVGFLAAIALPGLAAFPGELMILFGAFGATDPNTLISRNFGVWPADHLLTLALLVGLTMLLTTAYLLWTFQRIFFGPAKAEYNNVAPLQGREKLLLTLLAITAVAMGLFPWVILDPIHPSADALLHLIGGG